MSYSFNEAQAVVGGQVIGSAGNVQITHYAYDSRLPFNELTACFFSIQGKQRSGSAFISAAYARGVRLFCVASGDHHQEFPEATFWIVEDVLESLCKLAAHHRGRLLCPVVAITGSNGKTIVKEWLYLLLGGKNKGVFRSPGSFNSRLGVALSILLTPLTSKVAIYEAGISQAGEMETLQKMISPSHGIFTNLGQAHAAGFSSLAEKRNEKWKLFKYADHVISRFTQKDNVARGRWWTTIQHDRKEGLTVTFEDQSIWIEELGRFATPDRSLAAKENLTHAICMAAALGTKASEIEQRLSTLGAPSMRLSVFAGLNGNSIIDDSYSNDLEGLQAALDFYSQQHMPSRRGVLILGPMVNRVTNEELTRVLAAAPTIETLILVGEHQHASIDLYDSIHQQHLQQVEDVITYLEANPPANQTILVKGPRHLGFERIVHALRPLSHEVRLEIDLAALAENIATYQNRLSANTKICVMVKAQAYGSGAEDIAHFFSERGIDYLAVAYVDEGVALRKAGAQLPIIVGNTQPEQWTLLHTHRLEPEITTAKQLIAFAKAERENGTQLGVHIKLDTGMHRLGFDATDQQSDNFSTLLEILAHYQQELKVISLFSHLSASDNAAADLFSRKQNEYFTHAARVIDQALGYRPMRHLLNSAGAWRLPEYQHDMVRLGIGIYGLSGASEVARALTPAHRLVAQLISIRIVKAGDIVGYNLGGSAEVSRKIGVVNIGYADGLNRRAGNGAYSLIVQGKRCPTVGSVCMDFCMIDLSACPDAIEGDEVEIFGKTQPLGRLATTLETIPYEVLTGIGPRVRRLYYQ